MGGSGSGTGTFPRPGSVEPANNAPASGTGESPLSGPLGGTTTGGPSSGGRAPLVPARAPQQPSSAPSSARASAAGSGDESWTVWWSHNREAFFETIAWGKPGQSEFVTSSTRQLTGLSEGTIQNEIVPALLAALKRDPSAELKRGILLSLAKIGHKEGGALGSSEVQDLIIEHLTEANQLVAETACVSLGVLNRPGALPILANLLQDNEAGRKLLMKQRVPKRMRAYAAYGIGLLGQRTSMADVRQYANHVLLKSLGSECGTSPDLHAAAVIGLGMAQGGEQHIDALLAILESKREHDEVRAHAPASLAKLAAGASDATRQRVLDALTAHAKRGNEDATVQQGCMLALGQIVRSGPTDAPIRQELIKLAKQGKSQERGWALISLAQIAARPEAGATDPSEGAFEIQGLLLKSLSRSRSTLGPWAALSIGVLAHGLRAQGEEIPSSMGRALRDGLRGTNSPEQALAFGIGLGLARDAEGLPALQAKLAKFDIQTRATLNTALGLQGDPAASEVLLAEMHEARHAPGALASSAHSLALLKQGDVVSELTEMFDDCSCLLSASGITTALARTRHPDAVRPLLQQLGVNASTDSHRALAAVALGNLAEKEARPWSLRISQGVNYRAHVSTLTESDYGILLLP